jgi:hypothetical protein
VSSRETSPFISGSHPSAKGASSLVCDSAIARSMPCYFSRLSISISFLMPFLSLLLWSIFFKYVHTLHWRIYVGFSTYEEDLLTSQILYDLRFLTAVTMKNAVFWDVAPCSFCASRRFGGLFRLHLIYPDDAGSTFHRNTSELLSRTRLHIFDIYLIVTAKITSKLVYNKLFSKS